MQKKMERRMLCLFAILMAGMLAVMGSVYFVTGDQGIREAAARQSSYNSTVTTFRGTIYDHDLNPLTGFGELQKIASPLNAEDIFWVNRRYQDEQTAVHLLGYLDGGGDGVAGIEKAYNDYLKDGGSISVRYKVDALNQAIAGEEREVDDTSQLQKKGVVLTLDKEIQKLAESVAKEYLEQGAVVVTKVPSGRVLASVSMPDYNPNDIAGTLDESGSPLLNRVLAGFPVGSVFKLVTAATALEKGVSTSLTYDCPGSITVDGMEFKCFNGEGHGKVNMEQAIAYSCNGYFISLAQQLKPEDLIDMAKKLGFGESLSLAPGIASSEGNLPALKDLSNPKAKANFSFGQGSLLATPIQVAAMVNAIASDGMYTAPSLIDGLVDENLNLVEEEPMQETQRVLSLKTAKFLQKAMKSSVNYGTSKKGKPRVNGAGAKTSTAETGFTNEDGDVVQSWISGFYPAENPQYVITVFSEGGTGGGTSCGPAFREIADNLPLGD